jgi:hypothetical protein
MTTQFDFTNAEWDDIAVLPVLVGYAIAQVGDSGVLGSLREMRTLTSSIATEVPDSPAKSLIVAAGASDIKNRLDDFETHRADVLADVAVQSCTEVSALLAAKAEPDEIEAYHDWVLTIAYKVAGAAKEHGVRMSEPETALLARVRSALTR